MNQLLSCKIPAAALPLALAFTMGGLLGCATKPQSVEESWVKPRPLGQDLATYRPAQDFPSASSSSAPVSKKEAADVLTLRQALALALAQNPELAVYSWEVRMEEADILQSGLYPNPTVGLETENVAGTGDYSGAQEAETTLQISQIILMGEKRAKAVQSARLSRDLATWDYEIKRLDVFTRTAQAFVQVLSLQEQVALAENRVSLAREVVQAVSQRVEQALNLAVDQIRAEVALASAEIDLDQAQRTLQAARLKLSSMWDNTQPQFSQATGNLETTPEIPSLDSLQERLRQNPYLARWATEISRREANLQLEESRRVPDLTVSGGYRRLSGPDENVFVAGVSVPLPLFNKNQGGIRRAEYQLAQAEDERRAAELRLQTSLSQTWQDLSASQSEITAIQNKLLPGAQKSFDSIQQFYDQGRLGYLDVLEAQRALFAIRTQRLEALGRYHQTRLALERLIGEPLRPETSTDPLPSSGNH